MFTCAQVYATLIMFCLQCLVHMQTRKRMRQKYGLEEEPCNDFHVTAWCVTVVALRPVHLAATGGRCIASRTDSPRSTGISVCC